MSNSVKRFEVFRMFFAIVISLLISFVIIFLVSKEPLTAIYTLITGPFKSRRKWIANIRLTVRGRNLWKKSQKHWRPRAFQQIF